MQEADRTDLCDLTKQALLEAKIPSNSALLDNLTARFSYSIAVYAGEEKDQATSRETHDALRGMFSLLMRNAPPHALVRERFRELPRTAIEWMEQRAQKVWPRLTGTEFSSKALSDLIDNASLPHLIRVLRVLISDGGVLVDGRTDDRPAKKRLEPVIMGVTRGKDNNHQFDGRPAKDAEFDLVGRLAMDWLWVTGKMPVLRRSEKGFPGLVHGIFQLIGADGSDHALRCYIDEFRRGLESEP